VNITLKQFDACLRGLLIGSGLTSRTVVRSVTE